MKHLLAFPFAPAPPGHVQAYCGVDLPRHDPRIVNADACVMRGVPVEYDCPACKAEVERTRHTVERVFEVARNSRANQLAIPVPTNRPLSSP